MTTTPAAQPTPDLHLVPELFPPEPVDPELFPPESYLPEPEPEPVGLNQAGTPSRQVVVDGDPDAIRKLTAALNDGLVGGLYTHDGGLVTITVDQAPTPAVVVADDDSPHHVRVTEVKAPHLAALLADRAEVVRPRTDKSGGITVEEVTPSQQVLNAVLARQAWPGIPALAKVVTAPVLRPDGTLLQTPGYDAVTGYYLASGPGSRCVPPVPAQPTPDQVAAAKQFLLDVFLADFPWKTPADAAMAVAVVASPVLRSYLRSPMPFVVVDATMPGSGKTILTSCVGLLCGQRVLTWPESDEELRKSITAILAEPVGVVVFDNLTEGHVIDSAVLARLVTEKTWSDRRLGTNSAASFVQDRLWCATGNNLHTGGDMASRTVWVRLDPDCPAPEARSGFAIPNLDTWILDPRNQGEVMFHVLVLILDWVTAGAPTDPTVAPMRQFTTWARSLGGFCAHHGIPGFLTNAAANAALDEDAAEWHAFLHRWSDLHGTTPKSAADLAASAEPAYPGEDTWHGTFPTGPTGRRLTTKALGRKLSGQVGRWRTDIVLRSVTDSHTRANVYYVETTPETTPENPDLFTENHELHRQT